MNFFKKLLNKHKNKNQEINIEKQINPETKSFDINIKDVKVFKIKIK